MITYYLIDSSKLHEAEKLAATDYIYRLSVDGGKAIVRAEWTNNEIDNIGLYLGKLLPDGFAEQAVYDEIAKPEWQVPMD